MLRVRVSKVSLHLLLSRLAPDTGRSAGSRTTSFVLARQKNKIMIGRGGRSSLPKFYQDAAAWDAGTLGVGERGDHPIAWRRHRMLGLHRLQN